MNHVYLIQSLENGYYKIGVSKNPNKRIKQLQTGNPATLKLITIFKTEHSYRIESFFHKRFSHCRREGEWFELNIQNELDFLNECKKIENGVLFLINDENHLTL
jgi:predicted GIY-YIG superfamily endonuclease